MHEKILGLQATLRHINEMHGIDMRNPRGVAIDGRLYPSKGKAIAYNEDNDITFPDYTAGFFIPFENGLQSYFSIYSFPRALRRSHPEYARRGSNAKITLEIPTIDTRLYRESDVYRNNPTLEKMHRYGFREPLRNRSHPLEGQTDIWLSWMGKSGFSLRETPYGIGINQLQVRDRDEQDDVTQGFRGYNLRDKEKEPELTLHKILSDWSTLPHHGQLDIEDYGRLHPNNALFERRPQYLRHPKYPNIHSEDIKRADLALTQEELKEHRENYVSSTVYGQDIPPNKIDYAYSQDDDVNLTWHTYHIDTEELLPRKKGWYNEEDRDSWESKWEDWT